MKNILLIGGSYGIGDALAKLLLGENNVFIASRSSEAIAAGAHYIRFDASSEILDLSKLPNTIDGLVYCPGSINLKPFKSLKAQHFLEDLKINFLDMITVVQTVLPALTASGNASVVLFSSIAASAGMPFHTSVAAAKGAVEGFAKSFAAEFAPAIRVNVIAPSITQTPLSEKFLNNEIKIDRSAARHPLKKIGAPNDIAEMAAFLLSDKSRWISGQTFHVDGGLSTLQTQ